MNTALANQGCFRNKLAPPCSHEPAPAHNLKCMEVWGGNHRMDAGAVTPGLDLWIYSLPFAEAANGGDVHYLSLCGGGMITRFVLADVAGHGTKVSEVASWLRRLVARNINRKSQVRLVAALNERFAEMSSVGTFATAVVGTYSIKGSRLTLCNAGHPRPFLYRAATRQWSIVQSSDGGSEESLGNLPLGIDRGSCYRQMETVLDDGDLIFVYTDAVTESRSPNGEPLGERGLLMLLRGMEAAPPASMAAAITHRLGEFRGRTQPDDDLTFLLLRRNAQRRHRRNWSQTLDVYAKLFRLKRMYEPVPEEDTSHA